MDMRFEVVRLAESDRPHGKSFARSFRVCPCRCTQPPDITSSGYSLCSRLRLRGSRPRSKATRLLRLLLRGGSLAFVPCRQSWILLYGPTRRAPPRGRASYAAVGPRG